MTIEARLLTMAIDKIADLTRRVAALEQWKNEHQWSVTIPALTGTLTRVQQPAADAGGEG